MNSHYSAVFAIIGKDFKSLMPFVTFTLGIFLFGPVFELFTLDSQNQAMKTISENLFLLNFFILSLLTVTIFQLDPAASVNNDWLIRPISRIDLLIGKILFLFLITAIPSVLARTAVNLSVGYSIPAAFLDATILADPEMLIFLPAVAIASVVTNSPRMAIAIFMALVFFVAFPGIGFDQIGSNPLASLAGIGGVGNFGGIKWLQYIPIVLLMLCSFGLVYWFQYQHRDSSKARATILICAPLAMVLYYPPSFLLTWNEAFSIQQTTSNLDEEVSLEESVIFDHVNACFPWSTIAVSPINGPQFYGALEPALYWQANTFESMEDGAVAFQTTVSSRADIFESLESQLLTSDHETNWRTVSLKAFGTYTSSLVKNVRLRPSESWRANRISPQRNVITNQWLIDTGTYEQLANDPTTKFTIDYSMALLSPTSYVVETDSELRFYLELGYCKADSNTLYNRIDIECIKKGKQPTIISGELPGIGSSRIDASPPSYTPSWLEALSGKRYKWSIPSSSLSSSSKVIIRAYNQERFFQKQVISAGVLGSTLPACAVTRGRDGRNITESTWGDRSSHQVSLVTVGEDVQLEVLDWGYKGDGEKTLDIILLAGLGATAHVFDEIAPKLSEDYRVIGISRRGFGNSSKPDFGYDLPRLGLDIMQVIDTLAVEDAVLIGHSFAGEEMTHLATTFSDRFRGLVYLDAAYDRTTSKRLPQNIRLAIPPTPPPFPDEFTSYNAAKDYFDRIGVTGYLPEGEILASYNLTTGGPQSNSNTSQAIAAGIHPPNYKQIDLPTLAIYAVPGSPEALMRPWHNQTDELLIEAISAKYELELEVKIEQIRRFSEEVAGSVVIEIEDGRHGIFLSHETEVLSKLRAFIETLP